MKNHNEQHDDQKPKPTPNANDWAPLVLLGQVGFTIVFCLLVGLGIGLFIDHQFHTSPIATIIGLLLGLAAGVYGVYRLVSSLP